MAIVANLANSGGNIPGHTSPTDNKLCTPSRANAGTPVAVLTPAFPGELVQDTTGGITYGAYGVANTQWTTQLDRD